MGGGGPGMLQGTDPARVRAAASRGRPAVLHQRYPPAARHADTRGALAAVEAIGSLAGPGLIPTLMRLQDDPSPAVQRAAAQAIATIEG